MLRNGRKDARSLAEVFYGQGSHRSGLREDMSDGIQAGYVRLCDVGMGGVERLTGISESDLESTGAESMPTGVARAHELLNNLLEHRIGRQ